LDLRMLFTQLVGLELGLTLLNMPPVLNQLMALYGVSYVGISVLLSALLWSHTATQIPGGLIADLLGVKRTILIALCCLAAGNLMGVTTPSLGVALLGRVLAGFGVGLTFVGIMKMIALHAPVDRVGIFQAFFAGSFSIGSIMSYLAVPYLIEFGWQWVYLTPGLTTLLLIAIYLRLSLVSEQVATSPKDILTRVFRMRSGWIIGLMHAASWGTVITFGNWMPTLLSEVWGTPTAGQLAWGGALIMLTNGIGRWMGGFFLLRFSAVLVARGSVLCLAFLFMGIFLTPSPATIFALALTATWFASINYGAFFYLASRTAPVDSQATVIGLVNFLANLGAILFTLLFGFLKERFGTFEGGFIVLAALALIAFVWSHSLKETPEGDPPPAH
jgi:MFS family permease